MLSLNSGRHYYCLYNNAREADTAYILGGGLVLYRDLDFDLQQRQDDLQHRHPHHPSHKQQQRLDQAALRFLQLGEVFFSLCMV